MRKLFALVVVCSTTAMGCADQKKTIAAAPAPADETPKSATTKVGEGAPAANGDKWVTIKGKIIWDAAKGAAPVRKDIMATKDEEVAAKDKDFKTEDWVVNKENGGIQNVVIWIAPEPTGADLAALNKAIADKKSFKFPTFPAADLHPAVAKPPKDQVVIDQPCCRFIPHVLVAREGQEMLIKNSASVPHNAKWTSRDNGEINPLIPGGGEYKLEKPLVAERFPIEVACNIHPWMKAWVRVFDHPYFALTDKDGNFEIKNAPVMGGKLRMFIWQENGMHGGNDGRFGQTLEVKPGSMDLKEIKFNPGK
jgi:hypothetical protein